MRSLFQKLFTPRPPWTVESHLEKIGQEVPLGRWSSDLMFGTQVAFMEDKFKKERPNSITPDERLKVSTLYHHVFESHGKGIRYAFLPASRKSLGLVVVFHPWNGYQYTDHIKSFPCFDVLAPFDDFGPRQWSCGFWGLEGSPFLVDPIQELIQKFCREKNYSHWFTMGGSSGGFAALYHGIQGQCHGMYVMTPQIDIRAMSEQDLKKGYADDIYSTMISKTDSAHDPSILKIAHAQNELPPLFLIQSQYDSINHFEDHGYLLQKVYHQKKGWYGMRIHPSIGHRADGSQTEAEYFFLKIREKNPNKKFLG